MSETNGLVLDARDEYAMLRDRSRERAQEFGRQAQKSLERHQPVTEQAVSEAQQFLARAVTYFDASADYERRRVVAVNESR